LFNTKAQIGIVSTESKVVEKTVKLIKDVFPLNASIRRTLLTAVGIELSNTKTFDNSGFIL
jgi:hypothetical protein